jgi:DNA-binding MarR family transcriptional regulator
VTEQRLVLGGGSLLNQVGRELTTAVERQLAPLGLTAQQAAVILHAAGEPITPRRLAELVGTDTAGMTRLLDRLADKDLIRRTRHPEDRRSLLVELTDAGRALVPHLPPVFGRVINQLFTGFTQAEITQVTTLLERMHTNLKA